MDNLLIAERYAQALIEAAQSLSVALDDIYKKLDVLGVVWNENKDFQNFLLHPEIKTPVKKELIKEISKQFSFPEILTNTLLILLNNNRFALIKEITELFDEKANYIQQKATAHIKSATPLSEDDKKSINKKLCSIFNKKDIEIETETDQNLIGGIIINVGRSRIEATIKNTLNEIKNKITK